MQNCNCFKITVIHIKINFNFITLKIGSDRKTLKIADVGIAKNENEITGTLAGTPLYMAPEVFSESEIYDARADIYSFGLILWVLWYGQRVFIEVESFETLKKKIKDGYRPRHIGGCRPVILQLDTLMQKCWESEPDDRLAAADCVKEINRALEWWKTS
jgi:serine/threonine protein kinase